MKGRLKKANPERLHVIDITAKLFEKYSLERVAFSFASRLFYGFFASSLYKNNLKVEGIEPVKNNMRICISLFLKKTDCCQTISSTG